MVKLSKSCYKIEQYYILYNATFNNQREQKKKKNLKHKTKLHQLKVEFLKIQKINNLKQRCKKNKKSTKKLREREISFFVRENYAQKYRIEKIMKNL